LCRIALNLLGARDWPAMILSAPFVLANKQEYYSDPHRA
jgi:hypothetical protein